MTNAAACQGRPGQVQEYEWPMESRGWGGSRKDVHTAEVTRYQRHPVARSIHVVGHMDRHPPLPPPRLLQRIPVTMSSHTRPRSLLRSLCAVLVVGALAVLADGEPQD